jgi:hypothetical protein
MKRHRLERQDSFAGLIHRLDLFLKPARGAGGPELTVGIYDDIYRIGNPRCHTNGGDKGSCLKFAADAGGVGLAIDTRVTNIDIVLSPVVRLLPAPTPAAVLLLPVVLFKSA